jgi:ribulose kinase
MVPLSSDYYIGIDVGTGSARACIIDDTGDIVGLAAEDISTWEPKPGYYVCRKHSQNVYELNKHRNNRLMIFGVPSVKQLKKLSQKAAST